MDKLQLTLNAERKEKDEQKIAANLFIKEAEDL